MIQIINLDKFICLKIQRDNISKGESLPTTKKLMTMNFNSNLPKIQNNFVSKTINPEIEQINPKPVSNNGNLQRGFSQFGKSQLDNKQFFSKENSNNIESNPQYNLNSSNKGAMNGLNGQKNESDAKIHYRNNTYNNTYPMLGAKDYGSSYQLRNNQNVSGVINKDDPRNFNNLGGIITKKNDSLGALE